MEIDEIKIEELNPAAYNPRKDLKPGDPEYEHLKRSILEFDYIDPVIWNKQTGNVVGGHQRLKVLKELGRTRIQVSVVDLPPAQEKALNIALNKIAGDWDNEKLAALIRELSFENLDLDILGFDQQELSALIDPDSIPLEGLTDPDDVPDFDEAQPTITQPGDIWVLGRHRLVCGDCTSKETVARLMVDNKAWLGVTSPPYAVGKEYEVGTSFQSHLDLIRGMADMALQAIEPGGFLFLNFDDIAPQRITKEITGSERQCLYPITNDYWKIFHVERSFDLYAHRIWYKAFNRLQQPFWTYHTSIPHHQEWEHLQLWKCPGGSDDLQFINDYTSEDPGGCWRHLWTLRTPHGTADKCFRWAVSARAVWDMRKETPSDKPLTRHVAAYPVCLPERALLAHSGRGALIWEPFAGSGTTIIACERLARTCYAIEKSPHYCDIIVKRWEDYTGQKAVRNP
jgi:DNA modification methylase